MQPISNTKNHLTSSREVGFTLVELLIAITLSTIVITVFVSALMTTVKTVAIQKTELELSQEAQLALDTIERDARIALAFDTTPVFATFTDSYGPTNTDNTWSGTWSYKGTDANHRALILRESATTTNPLSTARKLAYAQGNITNPYAELNPSLNCTLHNPTTAPTGALMYNPPLPYYLIYFVRDNTLYRRVLTDTTTPLCNSQYQNQSCPATDLSPHANCRANDERIVDNVSRFTVDYNSISYLNGTATVNTPDVYSSTDPTILSEVSSIYITLQLQKDAHGSPRSSTLSLRVSRVN